MCAAGPEMNLSIYVFLFKEDRVLVDYPILVQGAGMDNFKPGIRALLVRRAARIPCPRHRCKSEQGCRVRACRDYGPTTTKTS